MEKVETLLYYIDTLTQLGEALPQPFRNPQKLVEMLETSQWTPTSP